MCHCSSQHLAQPLTAQDECLSFSRQTLDLIGLSKLRAVSPMQDDLCIV